MIITIRELRPEDDLNAVLSLCKQFFVEYQDHHDEFFDTHDLSDADLSTRFRQSMESDSGTTIVALLDGAIVGYIAVEVREQPHFYKIRNVGGIWGLMVARNHRRKGIGSRLLADARTYLQRKGIKYFTVYTATANQGAVRFYERNGMTPLYTTFIGQATSKPDTAGDISRVGET